MPTISIQRSSEYANRLRAIKLFLDGKEIGKIKNAESLDFEVAPGTHILQAKVDWCSSNPVSFHVNGNETKKFYMDSFAQHTSLGIFATIYYITFGAKKYLTIKEIS